MARAGSAQVERAEAVGRSGQWRSGQQVRWALQCQGRRGLPLGRGLPARSSAARGVGRLGVRPCSVWNSWLVARRRLGAPRARMLACEAVRLAADWLGA